MRRDDGNVKVYKAVWDLRSNTAPSAKNGFSEDDLPDEAVTGVELAALNAEIASRSERNPLDDPDTGGVNFEIWADKKPARDQRALLELEKLRYKRAFIKDDRPTVFDKACQRAALNARPVTRDELESGRLPKDPNSWIVMAHDVLDGSVEPPRPNRSCKLADFHAPNADTRIRSWDPTTASCRSISPTSVPPPRPSSSVSLSSSSPKTAVTSKMSAASGGSRLDATSATSSRA